MVKRSLGQIIVFFVAIFGTFGRSVTNLRGTFVENVKKVQNQPALIHSTSTPYRVQNWHPARSMIHPAEQNLIVEGSQELKGQSEKFKNQSLQILCMSLKIAYNNGLSKNLASFLHRNLILSVNTCWAKNMTEGIF
jgi:hypothetical protein